MYGTIVTAAVIAAGGNQLSTAALEATVFVTLVIYWLAEQYAQLLGEHTHAGRLPALSLIRSSLSASWPGQLLIRSVGRPPGCAAVGSWPAPCAQPVSDRR
jgi:hypothetical protein